MAPGPNMRWPTTASWVRWRSSFTAHSAPDNVKIRPAKLRLITAARLAVASVRPRMGTITPVCLAEMVSGHDPQRIGSVPYRSHSGPLITKVTKVRATRPTRPVTCQQPSAGNITPDALNPVSP